MTPTPFIGQITIATWGYAPPGWALCDGSRLPINAVSRPLYNVIGTYYGGDGTTYFNLPDLRGRAATSFGRSYRLGSAQGSETVALLPGHLPLHTHEVNGVAAGASAGPSGNVWAGADVLAYSSTPDRAMALGALDPGGLGEPHANMHPSLVFNFMIALQGIVPPRG